MPRLPSAAAPTTQSGGTHAGVVHERAKLPLCGTATPRASPAASRIAAVVTAHGFEAAAHVGAAHHAVGCDKQGGRAARRAERREQLRERGCHVRLEDEAAGRELLAIERQLKRAGDDASWRDANHPIGLERAVDHVARAFEAAARVACGQRHRDVRHLDRRLTVHGAGGGRDPADRKDRMARERAAVRCELLPVEADLESELLRLPGRQCARHPLCGGVVRRGNPAFAQHVLAVVRLPHETTRVRLRRNVAAAEDTRLQGATCRALVGVWQVVGAGEGQSIPRTVEDARRRRVSGGARAGRKLVNSAHGRREVEGDTERVEVHVQLAPALLCCEGEAPRELFAPRRAQRDPISLRHALTRVTREVIEQPEVHRHPPPFIEARATPAVGGEELRVPSGRGGVGGGGGRSGRRWHEAAHVVRAVGKLRAADGDEGATRGGAARGGERGERRRAVVAKGEWDVILLAIERHAERRGAGVGGRRQGGCMAEHVAAVRVVRGGHGAVARRAKATAIVDPRVHRPLGDQPHQRRAGRRAGVGAERE
eukprot:scaffold12827_cov68-Phaeocystis_antarctica.AAC.3